MPFTYEIDSEDGVVSIAASGEITPREALDTLETIVSDPAFRKGMHVLSDHRELETIVDAAFVRRFMARLDELGDLLAGTRAAFVESGAARYGMARMASILSEVTPVELRAFTDIDEARRWLTESDPR